MADRAATAALRDLLTTTKDGDWGKDSLSEGLVPYRVIRGADFPAVRMGDTSSVPIRYLSKSTVHRRTLEADDILLETAGGSPDRPTGRSILITQRLLDSLDLPATCASFARFLRVDRSKAEPQYVYWFLQHLYASGQMEEHQVQHTGVARFQYTKFSESQLIPLPHRSVQRAIAHILGALDQKVDLNRRMNAALEGVARALYKSWFIDFDPVRAKAEGRDAGLPTPIADIFPESFEDPELMEVPLGWHVSHLGDPDLFPLVAPGGFTNPGAQVHYIATGDVHRDHIDGETIGDLDSLPSRANMRPGSGRIWFAKMKDSPKYLWTMAEDDEWWSTRVLSTGFAGVQAARDYESFLYCFISSEEFDQNKNGLATGTTMQAVNNETIARIPVVVPPSALARHFDSLVRPLFRRRWSNARESGMLAALRDTLLPKLIFGELGVETSLRLLGSGD